MRLADTFPKIAHQQIDALVQRAIAGGGDERAVDHAFRLLPEGSRGVCAHADFTRRVYQRQAGHEDGA